MFMLRGSLFHGSAMIIAYLFEDLARTYSLFTGGNNPTPRGGGNSSVPGGSTEGTPGGGTVGKIGSRPGFVGRGTACGMGRTGTSRSASYVWPSVVVSLTATR